MGCGVTGLGEHLTWWPLLVYVVFATVPRLRRHWRPARYPERLGALLSWVLTVSVGLAMVPFVGAFRASAPLTGPNEWPFDLHWHLGLVELFVRQVAPEDSQVSGEALAYHWFAHADMAAGSLGSGVDPAVLASRLWPLPLVVLTLGLLVAVLSELTRHGRHAGVLAALFVAAPAGLEVLPWIDVPWDPVFVPLSPTQTYSYPLLLLAVLLLGRVLRGVVAVRSSSWSCSWGSVPGSRCRRCRSSSPGFSWPRRCRSCVARPGGGLRC